MPKTYLYLTQKEWADTWINGGEIPLFLASSYKSSERSGIYTPDENLIHKAEFPIDKYEDFGMVFKDCKDITIQGCFYNGKPMPNVKHADYYEEDGLILCFSKINSSEIAKKMGKEALVEIIDVLRLKKKIDKQLNAKGKMGLVKYTQDHQRGHFLKSEEDRWQAEYRLFWKINEPKWVTIPPGIAKAITPLWSE